jgi:outer membrane protein OmpA-like peptidoglycan-associated protein
MNNPIHRAWRLPVLLALGLSACANEQIVLLPGEEGHSNVVVVRPKSGGEEQILDQPYQTVTLGSGSPVSGTTSREEVEADFGATLAHMPPKPVRFIFYFPEGSNELTPESREQLPRLREEVTHRPAAEILIVGHTDTVGKLLDNDRLSLERAQVLYNILNAEGIDNISRIEVAGRGERELLVETADEVREPRNRRVEVKVR